MHTLLLRKAQHLKRPFFSSFTVLSSPIPHLSCSWKPVSTGDRESHHIFRAWRSSDPITTPTEAWNWCPPLKYALRWAVSINKERSKLVLPLWKRHAKLTGSSSLFSARRSCPPAAVRKPAHVLHTEQWLSHSCGSCFWTSPPKSPNPAGGSVCLHFLGEKGQAAR